LDVVARHVHDVGRGTNLLDLLVRDGHGDAESHDPEHTEHVCNMSNEGRLIQRGLRRVNVRLCSGTDELRLLLLPLDRTDVRLVGTLAGGESDGEKQSGEDQKALHGQNEIGKGPR
jgi:hypothetical protein